MNTIKHDGKTYEVLDVTNTESIKLITHAKLAGGLMEATPAPRWENVIVIDGELYTRQMQELNQIQPLRLVPNEPVTFEGVVESVATRHRGYIVVPNKECIGKRFRCVEIMEEA